MATTTALHEALNQGISSGNFVDTKIILYSHRDSSGRVGRPKVLYANSHVLKTVPYFNDCMYCRTRYRSQRLIQPFPKCSLEILQSQSKVFKKGPVDEQAYAEDYGYSSDSDLEDDLDVKGTSVAVPTKGQEIFCENHDERVERGKVVKILDMAFVT